MWLKSSQQTAHEGFWTCSIPNWFEAGLSGMAGLLLARDAIWHRTWGILITQKLVATKSKISMNSIKFHGFMELCLDEQKANSVELASHA